MLFILSILIQIKDDRQSKEDIWVCLLFQTLCVITNSQFKNDQKNWNLYFNSEMLLRNHPGRVYVSGSHSSYCESNFHQVTTLYLNNLTKQHLPYMVLIYTSIGFKFMEFRSEMKNCSINKENHLIYEFFTEGSMF